MPAAMTCSLGVADVTPAVSGHDGEVRNSISLLHVRGGPVRSSNRHFERCAWSVSTLRTYRRLWLQEMPRLRDSSLWTPAQLLRCFDVAPHQDHEHISLQDAARPTGAGWLSSDIFAGVER